VIQPVDLRRIDFHTARLPVLVLRVGPCRLRWITLTQRCSVVEGTQYWEHTGNAAIRRGHWKLVRDYHKPWELYDLAHDRSELADVAARHPDVVADLAHDWQAWADRVGVIAWDLTLDIYAARGQPPREAMG